MEKADSFALSHKDEIAVRHLLLKRLFDLLFSSLVLLLGLPLFALIALAVKLSSKGSVIYSHQRVGRGGRLFACYKFRTMYQDADRQLEEMLKSDSAALKEWEEGYKLKTDPRVTPIGKFLRKSSLDELPQFWNVLKGDLSVVGPRPVTCEEVRKRIGPYAPLFLSIRPGITGPWQVKGRSDTAPIDRLSLDIGYIESHTFFGDLRLILQTLPAMVWAKGAY